MGERKLCGVFVVYCSSCSVAPFVNAFGLQHYTEKQVVSVILLGGASNMKKKPKQELLNFVASLYTKQNQQTTNTRKAWS